MPRPKPPPTPNGSTDLAASDFKGSHANDMEAMFALPPPAMRSETHPQSRGSKLTHSRENSDIGIAQSTPPFSPQDKPLTGSPRHKRTASGVVKMGADANSASADPRSAYALPPPPSRARKIIQMKPKAQPSTTSSPTSDADYIPPGASAAASAHSTVAATKSTTSQHAASTTSTNASNSKRKQPSATSAAGRKIARKTAHSIIERRRRSKMNEEFGVLKDMIPACEGVEMHKLAILQAGIEYVKYLEGCVSQLKAENAKHGGKVRSSSSARMQIDTTVHDEEMDSDDEEERDEDDEQDDFVDDAVVAPSVPATKNRSNRHSTTGPNEWSLRDSRKSSVASFSGSSAYPSPHITSQKDDSNSGVGSRKRPILPSSMSSYTASPSQAGMVSSATPTPTLLSPAFNSIHFSPDLARTQTNSSVGKSAGSGSGAFSIGTSSSWTSVNTAPPGSASVSNPSPSMLPLPSPKAALGLPLPHSTVTALHLPPQYNAAIQREREAGNHSPSAVSDASGNAEATASAALMMLTNDWRGSGRPDQAIGPSTQSQSVPGGGADSRDRGGKGMSVRDLLSS
jgi:hypothetical protein